jgi:hypothetical protein
MDDLFTYSKIYFYSKRWNPHAPLITSIPSVANGEFPNDKPKSLVSPRTWTELSVCLNERDGYVLSLIQLAHLSFHFPLKLNPVKHHMPNQILAHYI